MASISSPGLGSGLDINSIITKLMQVESQPLTALQTKEASYQAKLTAFGSLKGALSALQTAAQSLKNATTFTGKTATSSDTTVLTATATSTASTGTYNINVTTLAKAHTLHTNVDYGDDSFDTGTLRITVGTGTPVDIDLSSAQTLSGIRTAINAAKAGVTANIVNDGTTGRLVLTSQTTGSAGAITITAPTTNNDGDRRLTELIGIDDPLTPLVSEGNLTEDQSAVNAALTINGMAITSSSNTLSSTLEGLTLTLLKEGSSSTVKVVQNTGAVTSAVNAFVKAYNDAITALKNSTAYDAANKKASVLTGDSTARSIQTQLASLAQSMVSGIDGGIARLSDIGISVQKDGTLATDSSKLSAALADPNKDVVALFTQTTSGNEGIAVRFNSILERIVGSSGLISNRTDGINASIKDLQKRADALNLRLEQIEKRYRAQFTALDSLIASMNQTSTYLTQQLANLPGAASSSN